MTVMAVIWVFGQTVELESFYHVNMLLWSLAVWIHTGKK